MFRLSFIPWFDQNNNICYRAIWPKLYLFRVAFNRWSLWSLLKTMGIKTEVNPPTSSVPH